MYLRRLEFFFFESEWIVEEIVYCHIDYLHMDNI